VLYPHLNETSRRQIWKTFIAKTPSAGSITDDEIDALAKEDMNGRQVCCFEGPTSRVPVKLMSNGKQDQEHHQHRTFYLIGSG
jgi:hypothetical protein